MFPTLAAVLLATAFDADMTVKQMRETGVAKLSAKEKRAFTRWLESNYTRKAHLAAKQNGTPILEENLKSGRYIRLSDKTLWEIRPADSAITQGWITPVEIKVQADSNDANYPYSLTNTLTGSSVRARKVETMNETPAPAPQKNKAG